MEKVKSLRLPGVVGVTLAVLLVLLVIRTQAWSDEMALARFEVVNHPQSPRANFFYGNALFKRLEQAQALGLNEDEKRALAVTSRQHFERMHSISGRELAGLVMLYQIDTLYFPRLAEKNDWVAVMQDVARQRRLTSSDRTALAALVGFSLTPSGESGRARVSDMLDNLIERYPYRMDLVGAKFRLLQAAGNVPPATLLALLEQAQTLNPGSRQAAAYLAQYRGNDDLAGTYEAIRAWLRSDHQRRELRVIREIFDN